MEWPQRPKMPRAYARWADKFKDWSLEHAVALVNGAAPTRYPTGSIIRSGCTGSASTARQTPFPALPKMPRHYREWAGKVRDWWTERRIVIAEGATLSGQILSTTGTGRGSAPMKNFPAFPKGLKRYAQAGQAVAAWCEAAVITTVQGGSISRYPTGTMVTLRCVATCPPAGVPTHMELEVSYTATIPTCGGDIPATYSGSFDDALPEWAENEDADCVAGIGYTTEEFLDFTCPECHAGDNGNYLLDVFTYLRWDGSTWWLDCYISSFTDEDFGICGWDADNGDNLSLTPVSIDIGSNPTGIFEVELSDTVPTRECTLTVTTT